MKGKAMLGGNWWEKLGKPQYGGEMVIRANWDIVNFDPYFTEQLTSIYEGWMERLVGRLYIGPSRMGSTGRKLGVYRSSASCCSSA